MRFVRFGLLCLLLVVVPVRAQQTQPSQQTQPVTTAPPAPKDTQALSILKQALAVAGGAPAITAVVDYTATGNVTYHWNPDVQGSVTIIGRGIDQFRQDTTFPTGLRSTAVTDGTTTVKSEDGSLLQVPTIAALSPASTVFPYALLTGGVNDPWIRLIYNGVVQIDGRSAHDVRVQPFLGQQADPQDLLDEFQATDIFIDVSTFQILMTQDSIRNLHDMRAGDVHQLRFSDCQSASGVLVPFSIKETVGGQLTWEIHLNQIKFNTGLQDSNFKLF